MISAPCTVSPGDLDARQGIAEQDLPRGERRHHADLLARRRDPVDPAVERALEGHRSERVEVVLLGEQQHGGDALELGAATGGVGQQVARARARGRPRWIRRVVRRAPAHMSTSRPPVPGARAPRSTTHGLPPTISGRARRRAG